jgi:hypothetical protein
MGREYENETASGEVEGVKHGDWPSLTLEDPHPATPTFSAIGSDHRLYPLAAWTYHHGDSLDSAVRAGLFLALSRIWPRGRRQSRHNRGFWVAWCLARSIPTAAIADKFCISEGEVLDVRCDYWEDWRQPIERARGGHLDDTELPYDPRPRIDTEPHDSEPFDPSTEGGAALSREKERGENWRLARELVREHVDGDLTRVAALSLESNQRPGLP